jgi:ribosomal protein S18 acetylase RimI-like enzyme
LRIFHDDPELIYASRIQRFFIFRSVRKNAENYFCYYLGKKAGMLSLRTNRYSEAFIYGIGVEEEFRKKGIGKFMMNFSEERARKLRKKFIALAVTTTNTPAIELYKKTGYSFLGEGTTFLSIPVEKIESKGEYNIKIKPITNYDSKAKLEFSKFRLGEIESISSQIGVQYMKENRMEGYHNNVSKFIEKGIGNFFLISHKSKNVGCVLFIDRIISRSITIYLAEDVWNLSFINEIASIIKKTKINKEIKKYVFRVSLLKANKLTNIESLSFKRNSSRDKYLMFKQI